MNERTKAWTPAFAGVTEMVTAQSARHSGESRNPSKCLIVLYKELCDEAIQTNNRLFHRDPSASPAAGSANQAKKLRRFSLVRISIVYHKFPFLKLQNVFSA
ncbi:MAG: hypothetical protein LBC90_05720 [Candidatus Adiutrix sp.]|nr:hypothetical protein [Candidatus Adiutrix sp.]